jgi:hypothetical protein
MIRRADAAAREASAAAELADQALLVSRAQVLRLSLMQFAQAHPAAAFFEYTVEHREDSSGRRFPWFSAHDTDGRSLDPDRGDDNWPVELHDELADDGYSVEEAECAFEAQRSAGARISVERLAEMLQRSGFYL